MNTIARNACTLLATTATAFLLAACGGGNDDDPTPSERTGVLTVTGATAPGFDGIYGDGNVNLTGVEKNDPIGSKPEVCAFKFDGINRVAGAGQASGDVRYRPDAGVVYEAYLTFMGSEFGSSDWSDVSVVRSTDRIRLAGKVLENDKGVKITVSGLIPMRGNRPGGC
ncbi:hypothetical protein [Pulveribacter suum]|uniref:Lipoprotein n=1 Tax=Pulveribacter suum TaxID=2116657 RepID=A0A2P1NIN3_9BURK|nr:hypothetical protein [Pulveribacter suum]AVP56917.1 hypothetical protein C7H73_04035 [Pulveribacter suum]